MIYKICWPFRVMKLMMRKVSFNRIIHFLCYTCCSGVNKNVPYSVAAEPLRQVRLEPHLDFSRWGWASPNFSGGGATETHKAWASPKFRKMKFNLTYFCTEYCYFFILASKKQQRKVFFSIFKSLFYTDHFYFFWSSVKRRLVFWSMLT